MKTILLEIRQWMGFSQREMASVLRLPVSVYSMAEGGQRSLKPDLTLFLIDLHQQLKEAPFVPQTKEWIKEKLVNTLEKDKAEMDLRVLIHLRSSKQPSPILKKDKKVIWDLPLFQANNLQGEWSEVLISMKSRAARMEKTAFNKFFQDLNLEMKAEMLKTRVRVLEKKILELEQD